ncbi:MAG: membrane protein insertase YidC [Fimbriimonadaceae bacterium]|nr:membrane protein insertase YidC [Fimbriimonadaceae bacterium]
MKPAPSPRQQIVQTLLITMMILMGFQLWTNSQQPKTDQPPEQTLAAMEKAGAEIKDVTIAGLLPQYERKVGAQEMPEEAKREKIVYAKLLTAVTQYRAGVQRDDTGRLDAAYHTLVGDALALEGKPVWDKEFRLPPLASSKSAARFPEATVSGKTLYATVTTELQTRNSKTYQYAIMDFLVGLTGKQPAVSYTIAALLLAIFVRGVVWPLSQRQLMWSRQMSQLQPLVAEIKEKYGSDAQEFQKRTMALYQEYGINPLAGCGPALIQMPLFLFVYNWMQTYRFEFQKGTFLWINEASSKATSGFMAPNLGHTDKILLGVYTVLMVVNTFLTPVSDPSNLKQQRMMGVGISLVFSISLFFWPLPSAFVLYWIFTLIFASAQSLRAYRLPMPPLTKKASAVGGVIPVTPISGGGGKTGSNGTADANVRKAAALTHKQKKKR